MKGKWDCVYVYRKLYLNIINNVYRERLQIISSIVDHQVKQHTWHCYMPGFNMISEI